MNNYLAFIILALCFGLVFTGSAQEFSRTMPQIQGQELGYMNSYYPSYYASYLPLIMPLIIPLIPLHIGITRISRLRLLSKMQKNVSMRIST